MKKLYQNHNYTLCHPEEKPKDLSRFFTTFRMTVFSRLSSSDMTAVLLTCLLLTLPTQARWGDNCTLNGGTIIKANQYGTQNGVNLDKGGKCNDPNNPDLTNNCNGMEFCVSNKTMNWWSAFTWGDSIGGKLVSFDSACPGTQAIPIVAEGTCANLAKTSINWVWTNHGHGVSRALAVYFDGRVNNAQFMDGSRNNATTCNAVCG